MVCVSARWPPGTRPSSAARLDGWERRAHLAPVTRHHRIPFAPVPVRRSLLLLPLALAACKVEPTPRSFYNHRDPAVVELQESEGEIRTRVINFVGALNRGDSAGAREVMNAMEMAQVMGPADDSLAGLGSAGLSAAIAALRPSAAGVARTPDLRVSATQAMGWFATHVEMLPVAGDSASLERMRLSGVFVRERGEWRLMQIHLYQRPAADSAAAAPDSASSPRSPASGAARAEDG